MKKFYETVLGDLIDIEKIEYLYYHYVDFECLYEEVHIPTVVFNNGSELRVEEKDYVKIKELLK